MYVALFSERVDGGNGFFRAAQEAGFVDNKGALLFEEAYDLIDGSLKKQNQCERGI